MKVDQGRLPTLGMAVDNSDFNRNAMIYEQIKNRFPVRIYWAPLGGTPDPKYDLVAALTLTSQQDYVLFRVPNLMDPAFTNKFNDQIRESIRRGELRFWLIKEYPLPDEAKALLYRRGCTVTHPEVRVVDISPSNLLLFSQIPTVASRLISFSLREFYRPPLNLQI